MDASVSVPCLETKLSKVSEWSGESHGAAREEREMSAVDDSEATLCPLD